MKLVQKAYLWGSCGNVYFWQAKDGSVKYGWAYDPSDEHHSYSVYEAASLEEALDDADFKWGSDLRI